jgi:hypothetical protein
MTRNQLLIGGAIAVCLLQNLILTVAPTIGRDPGLAACMAIAIVGMSCIPFALRRAYGAGSCALLIALGAALLAFNLQNALDALNGSHAAATSGARDRMAIAKSLNEKISDLTVRKGLGGPHKIVSQESADAAARAAKGECDSGRGRKCRDREKELADANRDRALTKIDEDLDRARDDLRKLGAVETTADQTATQLAGLAGLFWTPAAASSDAISTNRPIFKALMVECISGLLPWVLVTAAGAAPLPSKPKTKAKLRKGIQPPSEETVREWYEARVLPRAGCNVRAGTLLQDYEDWCAGNGKAPVNQTVFGNVMLKELGVQKTRDGNRTSYLGVRLKPKAIKGGADAGARGAQKGRKIAGEDGEAMETASRALVKK